MYSERAIKLALHCWLEIAPDPQSRKSTADLVITLVKPDVHSGNEPPATALQMVFNRVKVTDLTSCINFLLKPKHILVRNLCNFRKCA